MLDFIPTRARVYFGAPNWRIEAEEWLASSDCLIDMLLMSVHFGVLKCYGVDCR